MTTCPMCNTNDWIEPKEGFTFHRSFSALLEFQTTSGESVLPIMGGGAVLYVNCVRAMRAVVLSDATATMDIYDPKGDITS
jgi:hypothetical protein